MTHHNATPQPEQNTLYPVFFKLDKLNTLIVGGGNVGLEKLTALLTNSPLANITLVGTVIMEEIKDYVKTVPTVTLKERPFSPQDLAERDLLILATDDAGTNAAIYHQAKAEHLLVNVADTPHLCDFYLGSIVQKGNLKIAISTNGQSPTMAKRMREVLTEILPDEMNSTLQNLRQIRDSLRDNFAYKVKKLNEITTVLVDDNTDDDGINPKP